MTAVEARVEGFRLSVQQDHVWRVREAGQATWAQAMLGLAGPLDLARLAAALTVVTDRHEILRTAYGPVPGMRFAVQVVTEPGSCAPDLRIEDLRRLDDVAREERLAELARTERDAVEVSAPPLLRTLLVRLAADRYGLLLTTSPLSADAEAMRLFTVDLAAEYAGRPAAEAVVQYLEYAEWQHESRGDGRGSPAVPSPRTATPAVGHRLPLQGAGRAGTPSRTVPADLPADVVRAVHHYARTRGLTVRAVLLGAWQALLARTAASAEVVVGIRLEGRSHEDLAGCLGHFAKWVPAVGEVQPGTTFDMLAAAVADTLARADEREEQVLDDYAADAPGWTAAFDCADAPQPLRSGPVSFTLEWCDVVAEPCTVGLDCLVGPDSIRTLWRYRPDALSRPYVRVLAGQYRTLLARLVADPSVPVRSVSSLDGPARALLVEAFNDTAREVPGDCLHQLVEAQVRRTPDAPAVAGPHRRLTYRELDRWADRLAAGLRHHGVGPETRVGVCLPHGPELIAVLLAVLKAGGAYVPLDPAHPAARLRALLSQAGCHLVVAGDDLPAAVDADGVPRLDPARLEARGADAGAPAPVVVPDNLAYVMFTSGSTGEPKGVMVPHRAVVNYLAAAARLYPGTGSGAAAHSSVAFDLTVTSLFLPLVTGRTVHLDPAWRDVTGLAAELAGRDGLHLLKLTPSHLAVVNRVVPADRLRGTAACLVVGGEQLTGEAVEPWLRHAPGTRVFNEYGPTEAAVGCCVHEVSEAPAGAEPLPIGRPIANTQVYVLDDDMTPVEVGVPGEIYVGGASLARGYLDRPELTADRFRPDPFSPLPGRRLYRTGDLGCHDAQGGLRYLGRRDEQIKVRGARVEPAEIRAVLRTHPAVRDAAVADGPDQRLTAYLVGDEQPSEQELRAYVADRLPGYMVPDTYRWITGIPLTANGKLDRAALRGRLAVADRPVTPPRDAAEFTVVRLIEELLDRAPVGVHDDFFEIGGHSLLAVRLMAKINAAFGTELPVSVFFEKPGADQVRPATAAHLARAARRGGMRSEAAVRLRDGVGAPLFCFPPAGGDVVGYRDLAFSDVSQRPIYGLQPPLDGTAETQSVEFLADYYLAALRRVRPAGPYLLLGWSMGGLVAFETARRLVTAGEQVPVLALVESYPGEVLPLDVQTSALHHLAGALGWPAGTELPLDMADLQRLPEDVAIHRIVAAATAAGLVSAGPEQQDLERRLRLNQMHVRAAAEYRLLSYAGPVTLIQATATEPDLQRKAVEAWRRSCTGPIVVRELPGEHFTVLRRPAVDELARIVESAAEPSR